MKITIEDGTSGELNKLLSNWYTDAFKDGDTITLKYPDGTIAVYEFNESGNPKRKSYTIRPDR
jgi:hypothetical protein